jgi:hypothetical protein
MSKEQVEKVQVHVLVEHSLREEFKMPRGRKPGSKNKEAGVLGDDIFLVTEGEGGVGKNHVTPTPIEKAVALMSEGRTPLTQISARKMSKSFTLETRMVLKAEADQYKLPEIIVLQPGVDEKTPEITGKLADIVDKLDKKRRFYGMGDEVFGFAMQLVEEKSGKKKAGRPRKQKDTAATPAPAASTTV